MEWNPGIILSKIKFLLTKNDNYWWYDIEISSDRDESLYM